MVVEDEFLIAMELDALLQDAGFQVMGPVTSVASALDRIKTERPDAAVLDVSLRGEQVAPVAEVLHAMRVPYVLTSAFDTADFASVPVLASARNLGKPTPPGVLVAALHDIFGCRAP